MKYIRNLLRPFRAATIADIGESQVIEGFGQRLRSTPLNTEIEKFHQKVAGNSEESQGQLPDVAKL